MNICEEVIHYVVWPETVLMLGQEIGTVCHINIDPGGEKDNSISFDNPNFLFYF